MLRGMIATFLTVLLLSVDVGGTAARAGEWSPEYRATLTSTAAKRRAYRERRRWIRPINQAVSALIMREFQMYPYRMQEMALRQAYGQSGAGPYNGKGDDDGQGHGDDDDK